MPELLNAVPCGGIRPDSLGNYLAGLGLLAAASRTWPEMRACWRKGRLVLVQAGLSRAALEDYLLKDWTPTPYEHWWSTHQKRDTKSKSDREIWRARSTEPDLARVRILDAHIVGVGRNRFNRLLGTGGNIGKRDLAKSHKDACKLLLQPSRSGWLRLAIFGEAGIELPDLSSAGTWFVHANKTFNSGQKWYREGQLSPWSFLFALEGALLLVGGVSRRLGAQARRYAVFPFLSEPADPQS
jgi:hypothetical protein